MLWHAIAHEPVLRGRRNCDLRKPAVSPSDGVFETERDLLDFRAIGVRGNIFAAGYEPLSRFREDGTVSPF